MSRLLAFVGLVLLSSAQSAPASASGYDASWYKTGFWAGEYPRGVTLTKNVTTQIRAEPDPDAPTAIGCALEKGATYHPWNEKRVVSSGLEFISYAPIVTYEIKKPSTFTLRDEKTDTEIKISFGKGDEWTYLTYYAEGMFKMTFKGTSYTAEQDLIEASKEKGGKASQKARETDEWLKLTCANGASGWLLLGEVLGQPGFSEPEILDYGKASDAN